jgi:hypothetical protein
VHCLLMMEQQIPRWLHYHFYSWYCLDSDERDSNKRPSYYCTIPLHQCNKLFCRSALLDRGSEYLH